MLIKINDDPTVSSFLPLQTPMVGQDKKTVCCLCCRRGPLGLRVTLERTAYVCGENIRLHAQIENQSDQFSCVKIKLVQVCFGDIVHTVHF